MWRAKITTLKTTNLCNQFLITYLSRKKAQFDKLGMQKKGFVYKTAISSIKKYPLPIISPKQLKLLYGIGDLLGQELTIVIKHHYRDFLKKKSHQNVGNMEEKRGQKEEIILQENDQSINKAHSMTLKRFPPSSQEIPSQIREDDQKSNHSVKSAIYNKNYKPRPNTQASYIMIILKKQGFQDYMSLERIKEQLKTDYNQNITKKILNLAISNLVKSEYLALDSLDNNYVKITQKGRIECSNLQLKNRAKESQLKVKSYISQFISNISNTIIEKVQQKYIKRIVEYGQYKELILLIDNRQIKNKQQQHFFQLKLKEKYGIKCLNRNLPLGDFLWMYDGEILDYIIERKTADDLVSSIIDGRYHQQKARLKHSHFSNIYYLYEGHLTGSYAKNERQAATALLNTRVQDKFKVIQVNSISQSIKFINFLTETLLNKIKKEKTVESHGSLELFQINCGKHSNMTVQQIFGLSLKTIPGVGKNTVQILLKYFKSFKSLYNELKIFQTQMDRTQFLRQLFKGCNISKNIPEVLVKLFF